ncbi:MAG: DNA mismatch repair endonuclease MutL, partial [bacterium]
MVERPASVIKELLENAVDAGASRIDVAVERGGKDMIRIADNGCGMVAEDLLLAFQPHATSKLSSSQDLEHIHTLGFRGEALAAIAEISKVRCLSRTADADQASSIEIEGGLMGEIRNAPGSPGTVFEVRDLFFNTPVRRRFLKSDTTEAGHVVEAFQRVALAQPNIHMTYRSGGKQVYDIPAQAGLKERIGLFYGAELIEDLIWIDSQADNYRICGYVANPSHSRGSNRSQNFYVGGRFVKDRTLSHALTEAYRGLLMVGRQPVAFLKLDIPPEDLDVNVHPAKVEVRFRDSQKLYALLLSAIRQKFLASDLHEKLSAHGLSLVNKPADDKPASTPDPSTTVTQAASTPYASGISSQPFALDADTPNRQTVANWFAPGQAASTSSSSYTSHNIPRSQPPPSNYSAKPAFTPGPFDRPDPAATLPGGSWSMAGTSAQPFDADLAGEPTNDINAKPENSFTSSPGSTISSVEHQSPAGHSANQALPASVAASGLPQIGKAVQIHNAYLVVETADGVSLVDQHALHERILYEELRLKVTSGGVESQ